MANPSVLNNGQEDTKADTRASDRVFSVKYSPYHDFPVPNVSYDPSVNKIVRITPGGADLLLFPYFKDKQNAATTSLSSTTSTASSRGDVLTYYKQSRPNEKTIFELREPVAGLDVKLKGARLTVFQLGTSSDINIENAIGAFVGKL